MQASNCPRCDNDDLQTDKDGSTQCLNCGHSWGEAPLYTAEQLSSLRESHEMLEWLEAHPDVGILGRTETDPDWELVRVNTPSGSAWGDTLRAAIRSAMASSPDGAGQGEAG